jgi:serine/threonine-protein kinase
MSDLQIGAVLKGQYRLEAKLGEGGMAVVYRAYDLQRRVPMALKLPKPDYAEDDVFLHKFRREARSYLQLQHPNIVRFYDVAEADLLTFMVLEYINGVTLRTAMRQRGQPFTPGEVLGYLRPICAALNYAHSRHVIHCDMKPANVMIDHSGRVVVNDFGIARLSESATVTFSTPGTAAYMAPEQWRGGDDVYPSTDVYALGVMLYEMLTSRLPFTGDTVQSKGSTREKVMREHLSLEASLPSQINPQLPAAFDAIVLRCLANETNDRYQTVVDVLKDSEAAASQTRFNAPPLLPPQTEATPQPVQKPVRSTPPQTGMMLGGIGAVAVVSAIALLAWRTSQSGSVPIATESPTATAEVIGLAPTTQRATATLKPSQTPLPTNTPETMRVNTTDNALMDLVPGGDFTMGSSSDVDPYFWGAEAPPHQVSVGDFWVYHTEVTNAMYRVCVAAGACGPPRLAKSVTRESYYGDPQFDDYPVIQISWSQAKGYCEWAGGRLPTEAEWEKAARGTDARLFPWGNQAPDGTTANLCDSNCDNPADRANTVDDGYADTALVGSFPAGSSPYGALDMAGNVWEWVADWYSPDYYKDSPYGAPLGPDSGTRKIMRGGSYFNGSNGVRVVARSSRLPDDALFSVGFRCVVNVRE